MIVSNGPGSPGIKQQFEQELHQAIVATMKAEAAAGEPGDLPRRAKAARDQVANTVERLIMRLLAEHQK